MGSKICGFRRVSSNGLSKKDSGGENGRLTASVLEFMKPRCLWASSKIKKQPNRQENQQKQQQQQQQLSKNTCKVLTLEDWILSSPGFHVSKQFTNRIYPSLGGNCEDLVPESGENLSVEIAKKTEDGVKGQLEKTSLCRFQSGKMKMKKKKKVSFRSPEVAEVFILYPHQSYL